ncbi:MAG: hypothetical protein IIB32_02900 [Chloroflexi bacterium]|nr:hypothetical protein [Chloroflexota bacterium]
MSTTGTTRRRPEQKAIVTRGVFIGHPIGGLLGGGPVAVAIGQGVDDVAGRVEFARRRGPQQCQDPLGSFGVALFPAQCDQPRLIGDPGDLASLGAGTQGRVEVALLLQIKEAKGHQSLVLPPDAQGDGERLDRLSRTDGEHFRLEPGEGARSPERVDGRRDGTVA